MGGRELVRKISALAPAIPVIVTSGYSEEVEIAHYKDFVLPRSCGNPIACRNWKK